MARRLDRELRQRDSWDLNRCRSRPVFCSSHNRRRGLSSLWVLWRRLDPKLQMLLSSDGLKPEAQAGMPAVRTQGCARSVPR